MLHIATQPLTHKGTLSQTFKKPQGSNKVGLDIAGQPNVKSFLDEIVDMVQALFHVVDFNYG